LVIELNPQKTITLADAYTVFREFSGKHGVKLVERQHFEDLAGDIIKELYGLALRNDILYGSGRHQRGWRGLGLR